MPLVENISLHVVPLEVDLHITNEQKNAASRKLIATYK